MTHVSFERVSFAYDGREPLLHLASARFDAGWTGLVGANGTGKSTVLRLVSGELMPEQGVVRIRPSAARVVTCAQELERPPPGLDAVAGSMERHAIEWRARLQLDATTVGRWSTASPGERRRWQLGLALASAPDVLLLDEPTNHVDAEARAVLLEALRNFAGVGLIVSHDRDLLDALTVRSARLNEGRLDVKPGAWSAASAEWDRERRRLLDERVAAQDDVRRLERQLSRRRSEHESARRSRSTRHRMRNLHDSDAKTLGAQTRADWAEAGAGRHVALTRDQLHRAREAIPEVDDSVELGRSVFARWTRPSQSVLVTLDSDVVTAPGGEALLVDVHLVVRRDDRLAITGPNGAGKSALLDGLLRASRLEPDRWLVLPQELSEEARASDLRELRRLDPGDRGRVLQVVAALGLPPERLLDTPHPSPGESRKLRLALGLGRHVAALALDEPTNHLDLPSIERLERALAAFPGAILLVTHDDALARAVTTSTWRLSNGRVETAPTPPHAG